MEHARRDDERQDQAKVVRGREAADPRRGQADGPGGGGGLPALPDCPDAVLPLGKASARRSSAGARGPDTGAETSSSGGPPGSGIGADAGGRDRADPGKPGAQKGALAVGRGRHYSADEKVALRAEIAKAAETSGHARHQLLAALGLAPRRGRSITVGVPARVVESGGGAVGARAEDAPRGTPPAGWGWTQKGAAWLT